MSLTAVQRHIAVQRGLLKPIKPVTIGGYGSAAGHHTPTMSAAQIKASRYPGTDGLVQAAAGQGILPGQMPPPTGSSAQPIDIGNPPPDTTIKTTHTTSPSPTTPNTSQTEITTAPAAPPAPSAIDPRDAAYYANVAKIQFAERQAEAGLDLQDTQAKTNLSDSIRQLLEGKADDKAGIDNSESTAGGLYSGHRNHLQGNLELSYLERQYNLQSPYDQAKAGRDLSRTTLQGQMPLDIGDELRAAVARHLNDPTAPTPDATPDAPAHPADVDPGTPDSPHITPSNAVPGGVTTSDHALPAAVKREADRRAEAARAQRNKPAPKPPPKPAPKKKGH